MWKSLGFAIYWKRFCGLVVENEGLDSHGVQVGESEHVCERCDSFTLLQLYLKSIHLPPPPSHCLSAFSLTL